MWDKWKKKIQNFIWEEEIEEQEETTVRHNHLEDIPHIEAKMVYQYPTKEYKSTHFPVLPDKGRKRVDESDIPAFKRRTNRSQTEKPKKQHPSQTIRQEEVVSQSNSKKPFQPSDVPSPIYGFKQRSSQKEVEQIPAFKRNNSRIEEIVHSNYEDQAISLENEGFHTTDDKTLEIGHGMQEEAHLEEVVNEADSPIVLKEIAKEQKESQEQETKGTSSETEPVHKMQDQEGEQLTPTRQSVERAVPYNVMMTPRDKKNLYERKAASRKEQPPVVEKKQSVPMHLLDDSEQENDTNDVWVQKQQALLERTLSHFNVRARVVLATQGPSVTRFEIQPELGVKVSKIKNLSDDLKLNMAARDIRIEAPIPGKNTVGIEVPNPQSQMVHLQDIVQSSAFKESSSPLTIALGLSIEGAPIVTNIQKMPHGLIAGATGSGKSVCINTLLVSLIYKASPDDVKFLLIDPKMVELAPYNGIPHLVSPVITDVKAATAALKWAVNEMEDRYDKFVQEGVRDIERFNQKVNRDQRYQEKMPYIVIVIDELADLMMVSPQDVEDSISRIAQKARACGIHLLLATQRPSVDVLTGLIKANIPTRIAFSVSSQVDSRTIIDTGGAEKLLGKGDMLFIENGAGKSVRIQGPFVSDDEIERVTNYARTIAEPNYLFEQESLLQQMTVDEAEDDLLQEAIEFVLEQNSASTSLLQRHFKIGYNRAARLMDTLEAKGIISGQNGSKPRDILVSNSQLHDLV
ncbi:DNA segregation ATPase FtsK/SpoIIIE, S-DNA-T family [Oceanobacillus limi]|uniref:DNA segregation ATPase FtsK/SpoIIIE, S-DNA-T family n=1 Tax=Oceanobacillus limi TaxID=930131 RepID=A0A1I0H980_9BACI|nr:DNA translocase FtsK [Oceanobacillus limi]SET80225.1 DNA segregation ATPase FtsK/SpoIIIE, S-DNA-T family [Oceanobacillus limi]